MNNLNLEREGKTIKYKVIPIIVIICYVIGEFYKIVFKTNAAKSLIPTVMAFLGGGLGVAIYYTAPEIILVTTFWDAILVGIISGEAATGTHQIIKQLFRKEKK